MLHLALILCCVAWFPSTPQGQEKKWFKLNLVERHDEIWKQSIDPLTTCLKHEGCIEQMTSKGSRLRDVVKEKKCGLAVAGWKRKRGGSACVSTLVGASGRAEISCDLQECAGYCSFFLLLL